MSEITIRVHGVPYVRHQEYPDDIRRLLVNKGYENSYARKVAQRCQELEPGQCIRFGVQGVQISR